MKAHHWPWTTLLFLALGALCLATGGAVLMGLVGQLHPLLADEMTGWGLIVSAIACFLTGAFPLVLRRLAEREGA
jgi:predicted MFS family arabinose efflux permease